jgi:hypothetical protein
MFKRTLNTWLVLVVLLALPLAGCGGDADEGEAPAAGSFVGEVSGKNAFVAVVAEAGAKEGPLTVQVYVADGKQLSEWFSGTTSRSSFVANSDGGDAEAKGELSADSVTGTVELPDGKAVRYEAHRPGGAAGLYDLAVSPAGKVTGASAAGIGLTGRIKLGKRGTGTLRLADGRRLKFNVTSDPAADLARLRTGQVLLIVLPDGQIRGAGKSRPAAGGRGVAFYVGSA